MYSVKLKDNRITVQCNVIKNKKIKFIRAVYDTGAKYSCFRASYIDSSRSEDEFVGHEKKLLAGFVGATASKFYRFHVDRLALGNVDLGAQDVWVTFDENVTTNVIGYDVLGQVTRASFANSAVEMFFSSNLELKQYIEASI